MKQIRLTNPLILFAGIAIGLIISQFLVAPSIAGHKNQPVYEYAYGFGILETEGDAITLHIPDIETIESDWGPIEVYKTIEYPIAFEGGASGTEMWAINKITATGWELVCKYYVSTGHEEGHHYWFRRPKQ